MFKPGNSMAISDLLRYWRQIFQLVWRLIFLNLYAKVPRLWCVFVVFEGLGPQSWTRRLVLLFKGIMIKSINVINYTRKKHIYIYIYIYIYNCFCTPANNVGCRSETVHTLKVYPTVTISYLMSFAELDIN